MAPFENIDLEGQPCPTCGVGKLATKSLMDEFDGFVTCCSCHINVRRDRSIKQFETYLTVVEPRP